MPLERLSIRLTPVSDLSPLEGMSLKSLDCYQTRVSDLSPLRGMPLTDLNLNYTRVSDLSPLEGMSLTFLDCSRTTVSDLSPLRGMPLTDLNIASTLISDLTPLAAIPVLKMWGGPDVRLFHRADEQLLRSMPLTRINNTPSDEFWEQIAARREAVEQFARETGALPTTEQVQAVVDKLRELNGDELPLGHGEEGDSVTSATLVLKHRNYDLGPLRALSQLRQLNLTGGPHWLDISPINSLPLEELTCREEIAFKNAPVLREMETLQTINGRPKADYLDELQARYTWTQPGLSSDTDSVSAE
jgi:Leucine-rich repeat (LRR) protein